MLCATSFATSVRRGMPSSAAACVWLPAQRSRASTMRCRSRASISPRSGPDARGRRGGGRRGGAHAVEREVLREDRRARAEHHRALDGVAELADVARPAVALEQREGLGGERRGDGAAQLR
jgi:hypothetical protein